MAATGITKEYIDEHKSQAYRGCAISLAVSIVLVFMLALLIQNIGIDEALDGLILGLMTGVGLVAATTGVQLLLRGQAAHTVPEQSRILGRRLRDHRDPAGGVGMSLRGGR
jgi:hypothetical protein